MKLSFDLTDDDGSLERAKTTDHYVALDPSGNSYLIAFEDGEHVHQVYLERTPDGFIGDCYCVSESDKSRLTNRCPGLEYHEPPCAHLWAVWSWIARQRRRDNDARHADHVERAVADGGFER